ncbi:MAG: hypothetical protein U0S50_17035 [Sphingopyxis sp.]|uniref:hypothetical protein n=1 Tax=Sphingopyxis sp. TaxID=1908224 RepID=UPI002ABB4612|nr:hypothetical protein [Sphingopyxis sp.]MDZ3833500.1 hypothetical protein [Sphingopyxis sp.]
MKKQTAFAAILLLASGCSAPHYSVNLSSKAFLPHKGAPATLGAAEFAPDAVMFETPVGFRKAARLDAPVEARLAGKDFSFVPGDQFAGATLYGKSASLVPKAAAVFCGNEKMNAVKALTALSTLGASSLLNRTGNATQICLIDSENDAAFDQAILSGVKRAEDVAPTAITPTAYKVAMNDVMAGESLARIIYRGKTGMVGGHISFDLHVIESGARLAFDNVRRKVDIKSLPQEVALMGTIFTVKSYDPASGKIEVDVARGFPEGTYGLTTTTRTSYIPIYIPR